MAPADLCLLMLPWRALAEQFPGFVRPHNPLLDPIQQYLPWRIYAVECLRSGFVPLWNPYAGCGTPFLANLQSTLLYPPNALFLITGARHGFGISAILHLILGGLFMFGFLRGHRLGRVAAALGALVFMFNGFTVSWLEYPTLSLWVLMWLPAALLCYDRARACPRSVWPALCALILGLQFLGGHFQIAAYTTAAFCLYAAVGAVAAGGRGRVGVLWLAAVCLALGLALAGGQVLPTLELAGHSGRVARGAGAAVRTALPLTHLVLYLAPNYFGNPAAYNYWGNFRDPSAFNYLETACYVGILTLFLAAWALRRWREPLFWFLGAVVLFALLAATGSPIYYALYYLVPGFRELAGLGRALCLAAFGLAGLAAMGLDELLVRSERAGLRPVLAVAAAGLTALAAAGVTFGPAMAELPSELAFPAYLGRQLAACLGLLAASALLIAMRARLRIGASAFGAAAIGLVALDVFGFWIGFNPFVEPRMAYPETEAIQWLREQAGHYRFTSLASSGLDWMPHNAAMVFGLRDIHISDSLRIKPVFELVCPPGADQSRYPPPDSPVLDRLGVRYLMTRAPVGAPWRLAYGGGAPIYENPEAKPRAYVTAPGQDILMPGGTAAFVRDEPDVVVLKVTAPQHGRLVLVDSYYPGWSAWLDGGQVPLVRANGPFRAVEVPAGEHLVEMRYQPGSYRVGVFISLAALAALAAWAAAMRGGQTRATAARS